MRSQISLLQVIGFLLLYAALGFLVPITNLSLNPFGAAPFWIVTSALSVLLLGLVLALLGGRFTAKFQPTRLQRLGVGVLSLVLFLGAYLLSTHGTQVLGAFPIVLVIVIVFGMQIRSSRSQQRSYKGPCQG
jgi:uncharacterized protein YhhL (DUF1145 family)